MRERKKSRIIINPLTARVVGAPQMILQPVFSMKVMVRELTRSTTRTINVITLITEMDQQSNIDSSSAETNDTIFLKGFLVFA